VCMCNLCMCFTWFLSKSLLFRNRKDILTEQHSTTDHKDQAYISKGGLNIHIQLLGNNVNE